MTMTDPTTHTTYALARLADCHDPDTMTSPGARFLDRVESAFLDMETPDEDRFGEEADQLVPIYTHERWQVFVDLCAYEEDISEFGDYGDDLTRAAGVALYMIAERLLRALYEEAQDNADDDEEDTDDDE